MDDTPRPSSDRQDDRSLPPASSRSGPEEHTRKEQQEARRHRLRLVLFGIFGVIVLCAAGIYAWRYFTVGRYVETTDNAYTAADIIAISPQVSGYISELRVTDNQQVKRGEVLARIDDRPYRAAVDQANADIASAKAQIATNEAQIEQQKSQIAQAETEVSSAEANLKLAQDTAARYTRLRQAGVTSVQTWQQANTTLQTQQQALQRAQAGLNAANKQMAVLTTQRQDAEAALQRSQAALEQAQLNLGYTTLVAPSDGAVGNRAARLGLYVQPGVQLMFIVPMRKDIYVVANYKETEIGQMFRGQHVTLSIDSFSGITLRGKVDSLAPGTGSQFSLLPPENATGNFTKIVQRVPVKILLDPDNPALDQMRPGLSVEASVDTRTTPTGPKLTLVQQHQ